MDLQALVGRDAAATRQQTDQAIRELRHVGAGRG
jgi:hypothetical protein